MLLLLTQFKTDMVRCMCLRGIANIILNLILDRVLIEKKSRKTTEIWALGPYCSFSRSRWKKDLEDSFLMKMLRIKSSTNTENFIKIGENFCTPRLNSHRITLLHSSHVRWRQHKNQVKIFSWFFTSSDRVEVVDHEYILFGLIKSFLPTEKYETLRNIGFVKKKHLFQNYANFSLSCIFQLLKLTFLDSVSQTESGKIIFGIWRKVQIKKSRSFWKKRVYQKVDTPSVFWCFRPERRTQQD